MSNDAGPNATIPLSNFVLVDIEFVFHLYAYVTENFRWLNVSDLCVNESIWLAEMEQCRSMFPQLNYMVWYYTCVVS